MHKLDRIYQLHGLLASHRYPVAATLLCDRMECSSATLKRHLAYLKDVLGAPVVNKRGIGYFYDPHIAFELPGLWFNAQELHALLSMRKLLDHLGSETLKEHLSPIQRRLDNILAHAGSGAEQEIARIRILTMLPRSRALPHFPRVSSALLTRKRLSFAYTGRGNAEQTERQVSPQRLTHYRDNWYLDAYCHLRQELRTFAVERMAEVHIEKLTARNVNEATLDEKLGSAYGIFSGQADQLAVLRFTPKRARWVADETWHPEQESRWLDDGFYELRIPYANDTELILDICRYGPDVVVVAPQSLRQAVAKRLHLAANQYD
jgi:predicted DNA-binding transcriptional regulator YafY